MPDPASIAMECTGTSLRDTPPERRPLEHPVRGSVKHETQLSLFFSFIVVTHSIGKLLTLSSILSVIMLIPCFSLTALCSTPPEVEWERTYTHDEQRGGVFAQETADGGFIVAASTSLLKTDVSGNIVWELPYQARFVQQTTDGGYIVAVQPESGAGMGLVKLDASAPPNEEWSVVFTEDDAGRTTCVRQTSDGGYIIAGWENGGAPGTGDFLVKTDPFGIEEWRRAKGCYYCSRTYRIIYRTDDGGFIGTGCVSHGVGSSAYVLKFTEAGEIVWEETYRPELGSSLYGAEGECVSPTADGGYVIFGEVSYERSGDRDIFMTKTDGEGNVLWSRVYSNPQASNAEHVVEATDGGYIVVGDTWSEPSSSWDVLVFKVDEMGNVMWEITLGASDHDHAHSVGLTADGGYIIAGSVSTPFSSLYLCKLAPAGGIVNEHPVANAGPSQNVIDTDSDSQEMIVLDGSGSYDPDGSIESYAWFKNGTQIASGLSATVMLPIGVHVVALVVTDTAGGTDADETEVGVFPPVYITTELRVNRQQITPSFCSSVVGGPCFGDIAGLPYFVGDTLGATFTVTNTGTQPAALEELVVGGRFNDGQFPDGSVPDFTAVGPITLQPQESFQYAGTLELAQPGEYHFFCAYELPAGGWNTSVPLGEGLADEDRVSDSTVLYGLLAYSSESPEAPVLEVTHLKEFNDEREFLHEVIRAALAMEEAQWRLAGGQPGGALAVIRSLTDQLHPGECHDQLKVVDTLEDREWTLGQELVVEAGAVIAQGLLLVVALKTGQWEAVPVLVQDYSIARDIAKALSLDLVAAGVEEIYLSDIGAVSCKWPSIGRMDLTWLRAPRNKIIINYYVKQYDKDITLVVFLKGKEFDVCPQDFTEKVWFSGVGCAWNSFISSLDRSPIDPEEWIESFEVIGLKSAGELRMVDGLGRITGSVEGEAVVEIPGSAYDEVVSLAVVLDPSPSQRVEIEGLEEGVYGITSFHVDPEETSGFNANHIPIEPAAQHQYVIDWDTLAQGSEGVSVSLDSNGDGEPEISIDSGATLEATTTEMGENVHVSLLEGSVSLEFDLVVESGNTFVSTTESLPTASQEQGIECLSPFYKFISTVSYTGNISITLAYDDTLLTKYEEEALKLFRVAVNGTATDITIGLNTEQNLITGITDSFSSFAVGVVLSEVHTPAVFRVTREGDVRADGAFYGTSFETTSADIAEWVPVSGSVEPGAVLDLDPDNPGQYRKARGQCSDLVAGVVSSDPGAILGSERQIPDSGLPAPDWALLALIGIVPVRVTNEGGPIQPGDLLVTSSTPGHAMRWDGPDPCPCCLVGKALEAMMDETGVILVLLTAH